MRIGGSDLHSEIRIPICVGRELEQEGRDETNTLDREEVREFAD